MVTRYRCGIRCYKTGLGIAVCLIRIRRTGKVGIGIVNDDALNTLGASAKVIVGQLGIVAIVFRRSSVRMDASVCLAIAVFVYDLLVYCARRYGVIVAMANRANAGFIVVGDSRTMQVAVSIRIVNIGMYQFVFCIVLVDSDLAACVVMDCVNVACRIVFVGVNGYKCTVVGNFLGIKTTLPFRESSLFTLNDINIVF